ncbi:unnamed protein product [marine sediment metagenome]|uniref:Uncharacterized protein n=1 Tax=marine sediment metagenome TaxID=412755 RepID=X1RJY2_9ZZZZ
MTIDEAIKTLKGLQCSQRLNHWPEVQEATRLGIEGLEQIKEARKWNLIISEAYLPGETEESEKQPLAIKQKPS